MIKIMVVEKNPEIREIITASFIYFIRQSSSEIIRIAKVETIEEAKRKIISGFLPNAIIFEEKTPQAKKNNLASWIEQQELAIPFLTFKAMKIPTPLFV